MLAISGLHVGILLIAAASAGETLFGRRAHLYLMAPLAAIWLYTLLSGASPSAMRAAVMGTVYIGAIAFGRRGSLVPSLAIAAALMAAIDPRILYRISFQLSFAAMMGISIFYDAVYYRMLDGMTRSDGARELRRRRVPCADRGRRRHTGRDRRHRSADRLVLQPASDTGPARDPSDTARPAAIPRCARDYGRRRTRIRLRRSPIRLARLGSFGLHNRRRLPVRQSPGSIRRRGKRRA